MKDYSKVANLGPGPWEGEFDIEQWVHKGLCCLIIRSGGGFLNGYVAMPPGHPLHGKHYDEEGFYKLHVHGGITYAGDIFKNSPELRPHPLVLPDSWWVGFDTGHSFDYSPAMADMMKSRDLPGDLLNRNQHKERYRDIAYVRKEVRVLADFLLDPFKDE